MKVTVSFGRTGVVVPCRDEWTVRELIQQATQRYIKTLEKDGNYSVKIHHIEYIDGGILDPDDVLADLVDDKDKLIAYYEEQETQQREGLNGSLTGRRSPPDNFENGVSAHLAVFQPISGEIEVNSSALKSSTPLLVRRSSDPALGPPAEFHTGVSHPQDSSLKPSTTGVNQALTDKGGADQSRRAEVETTQMQQIVYSGLARTVTIAGDAGPLGIHVVPYISSLSGRALGLYIRGVEENSRSKREGLFQDNECIVKINDIDLMDKSFAQSQELFRQAMKNHTVSLNVLPAPNRDIYEKNLIGHLYSLENENSVPKLQVPLPVKPKPAPANQKLEIGHPPMPQNTSLSPTKNTNENTLVKKNSSLSPLVGFGSKKIGKKIKIDLKKGLEGLGFTVVTRDSSVHGPGPILVKNILPRGAAVKDGRMQSGDRILEVNGTDIAGKSQEELVAMLRGTKQGETVSLIVARQEEVFLPRELKGEQDCAIPFQEGKEQMMFEVPLNDSGSAGLGVSLKGNKSRETGADLGIFIKSIIHGGAAYKDGRLRVNDQLIAVNGESLRGKSNHKAMETLRRSMSMEGNIRGMIQLVVARRLEKQNEEHYDSGTLQSRAVDSHQGWQSTNRPNDPIQPTMVTNDIYERIAVNKPITNGRHEDEEDEEYGEEDDDLLPPPLPPHPNDELLMQTTPLRPEHHGSLEPGVTAHLKKPHPGLDPSQQQQPESSKLKTSKSMDLVADESNVGSLAGQKSGASPSRDVGPTLGLKKSSSLESLQTAVAAVRKNDVPFHRPRPHMVRGRGCNESFRTAIDKSYDGPPEMEEDGLSDASSGRDTPASGSSRQGFRDTDEAKKDKKKKNKDKKKEKVKDKGKDKDKKRAEDAEEQEKKGKKKGFGAMLRFGKKKDEKGKPEQKILNKQRSEMLSEEELEKMKEERERIEAKHQELREKQAKVKYDHVPAHGPPLPDFEDDVADPNYAQINNFREKAPPQSVYRSPSPHLPPAPINYQRDPPADQEHLEGLYAKVNKPRSQPAPHADSGQGAASNVDRIQRLRKEYHQARREGVAPPYEEIEGRWRGPDYEHRVPGRGHEARPAVPRYEDIERQYASLPRRGPVDLDDYPKHPRPAYGEREHPSYPGLQPAFLPYPARGNYPRPPDHRGVDPRQIDPGYYPPPPPRGPKRQDVPPSPAALRGPRFETAGRTYHGSSPEPYSYGDNRNPDPRQKNTMTAAV
ncbi:partitioning defective 3 homolog B-like isoform X1 [Acipenser ruthenus]|uniref:partitioning defective 3 homolog B-like isoform X1 n=1 Tax=Acipenser ruthenus TaxID=7906 RepID=UPI002741A7B9|nr:partitioning defective 3 homolog B-like isoform X1 [Acipenser ruthenus]